MQSLKERKGRKMGSYELKKEVRNASKEYLLELKEKIENEYRTQLHSLATLENSEHLPVYHVLKVDYLDWLGDIAKKLDVINTELRRMEYMG